MDRRQDQSELRNRLLEALRSHPGGKRADFEAAAKIVGVEWRTARRAWQTGWRDFRPIRDQVAEIQVRARAEMATEVLRAKAAAAPALAQEDAVQAAARDGMLARAHRDVNTAFIAKVGGPLVEYAEALAGHIRASIGQVGGLTGREALTELKALAGVLVSSQASAQGSIVMERLVLGEPGAIVGLKAMPAEDPSLEVVQAAAAQLQRRVELLASSEAKDGSIQ